MLLALVLVLGILPTPAGAAGGEGSHISVLDTAPAAAEVAVGSVYELVLSTVFSDREGHALTYSLGGGAFGEHTKIADGKLYFSVSEPGDYTPVITASCEAGSTASHTIAVTVTEADGGNSTQYGYDETPAASRDPSMSPSPMTVCPFWATTRLKASSQTWRLRCPI